MDTFDSIVFDLDGTLWDTCKSCAIGWNAIRKQLQLDFREITVSDVRRVMGKPHELCIRETFSSVPEAQLLQLIELTMIEDNLMVERHGGTMYDGVASGLERLSRKHRLCIVSNCQSGYIETFLKFTHVETLFVDFECWGTTRKSKGENLASLIARNGLVRPVMVGDMEGDREAAKHCGVPFYHVTYGFGTVIAAQRSFDSFGALVKSLDGEYSPHVT